MELPALQRVTSRGRELAFREILIPPNCYYGVKKLFKASEADFLARGWGLKWYSNFFRLQQWLRTTGGGSYALTEQGLAALEKAHVQIAQRTLPLTIPDAAPPPELPSMGPMEALLKDYQVQSARQLLRALRNGKAEWGYCGAWDTSDTGLGKTYETILAAHMLGLEIVVICPASTIGRYPSKWTGKGGDGWLQAFAHFGIVPRLVKNYEALKGGNRDWLKIVDTPTGGRKYRWQLKPEDTIIIFDEAHRCRSLHSLETAMMLAAIKQEFPIIAASATIGFSPLDMYATGQVVGLHKGGQDFHRFLAEHGCTGNPEIKPGKRPGDGWKVVDEDRNKIHLKRINAVVQPMRGARVRKVDLGDRIPASIVQAIAVDTKETQAIARAFEEALNTIQNIRERGDLNDGEAKILRRNAWQNAWHESERLKVDFAVKRTKEELDAGNSVALFANFTDVRLELAKRLKCKCQVHGGQNKEYRTELISRFREDHERVIILQAEAGGTGVNLQDIYGNHPRVTLIMPPVKAISFQQILGRTPRIGGMSVCMQYILYALGTVEEGICDNVRAKIGDLAAVNDGDLYPESVF